MSYEFSASLRTDAGKGASRRLRREGKVPAVVYGADQDPVSIAFDHDPILHAQDNEGFYSHILTLDIDGSKVEVIVKDIQRHPFKPKLIHMDFQRVDATHKVHTSIPLHFVNEDAAAKSGVVVHNANEIEITCLPKDLPEFIEVDIANLEAGSSLHLSDLALPAGVVAVQLQKDHDNTVVSVEKAKAAPADEEEAAE